MSITNEMSPNFFKTDSGLGGWRHRQGPISMSRRKGTLEVAMMILVKSPPFFDPHFHLEFLWWEGFGMIFQHVLSSFSPRCPFRRWRKTALQRKCFSAFEQRPRRVRSSPCWAGCVQRKDSCWRRINSQLIPRWKMKVYFKQTNHLDLWWIFEPSNLGSHVFRKLVQWSQKGFKQFFFSAENFCFERWYSNKYSMSLFGDAKLWR